MILLNRINGQPFALNPDLIERAEPTPDTVITLVTGAKYVVAQSLDELAELAEDHRAGVLGRVRGEIPAAVARRGPRLSAAVLPFPEGDR